MELQPTSQARHNNNPESLLTSVARLLFTSSLLHYSLSFCGLATKNAKQQQQLSETR